MFKEYMKFTRKRPLTGLVIGASLIYGADMIRKAATAESGGFWGIGASTSTTSSTSASHSMMDRQPSGDMMNHPTALFGIGNANEETAELLPLMGVPAHLKRRVGSTESSESYRPTNRVTPDVESVETVLGWI